MSRRSKRREPARTSKGPPAPARSEPEAAPPFLNPTRVGLGVVLLLTLQLTLAVRSLILENPTIDEVIHLPAGITYWQTGSFRMYPHNPPLVKLIAALPVWSTPIPYNPSWWDEPTNKAMFAHEFQQANAAGYFELFSRARVIMPLFMTIGGLVVFFWSRRLYGPGGGLLSLALWIYCPNVLAHGRLVTTDMGATALGVLATYVFWRYLMRPSWWRVALAGLCLGLAELTKFSLVLLYGLWPLFGVLQLLFVSGDKSRAKRLLRGLGHGAAILLISIVVIDVGYAFEGVGTPLGRYELTCRTLTRPVRAGDLRPKGPDALLDAVFRNRVNRFRGTWLGRLPVPLPRYYVVGFDAQKLEAEGIPLRFIDPRAPVGKVVGYPVYLDGELRDSSWWYYYLMTLVYKVPEGTWLLVLASLVVLVASPRSRASWFDELVLLAMPVVVLFVMSIFTNINLGLRYVLPIFPYGFIAAGKLVPWAEGLTWPRVRRVAWGFVGCSLALTAIATVSIAPHYLAFFNVISGGPDHGSRHLIDSNLDWGQDLVGLREWLKQHAPKEEVGLAYFGQINPMVFDARLGEGLNWFLPPPLPGTMDLTQLPRRYRRDGLRGLEFKPGLYAVSASLVQGLKWRVYDHDRWAPYDAEMRAYVYFQALQPIAKIGYSIFVYRVTPAQAQHLSRAWPMKRANLGPR